VAPIPQARGGDGRFAFSDWTVSGSAVMRNSERGFGPILWTTHTLTNDGTLKVLAQFAPVDFPDATAVLHVDGREAAREPIERVSRTAAFRVSGIDTTMPHPFRVGFRDADGSVSEFDAVVRAIPKSPTLTIAALSCNDATGFPHPDLVRNVSAHAPDLVAFLGDQIYEGIGGYGLVAGGGDRAVLSYLRKFFMHGWTWRGVLRDIPSVTIPDDHDVFHGNLWGCGGKRADISLRAGYDVHDSGGYKMSPDFVNAVHRTQTGNLPDPPDPAPCSNGISVYFTSLRYGALDAAIVADRQWKSAPKALLPEARIENGWPQNLEWNPKSQAAHPAAQLLGPRQEAFLETWAEHRAPETTVRLVFSQSPWCAPQTLPANAHHDKVVPGLSVLPLGEYPPDDEPKPDFDTNGWPQVRRNHALRLLKKARALHIAGDQHLGTTGQYGIDEWNDGPWWLVTPATANIFPRRWMPAERGRNQKPGAPRYTGEYEDAFGNKMTIHAVANPHDIDREPARLFDRAVGYGIVRADTRSGTLTLAAWPYWSAPDKPPPDNAPYPGWPITINP
jgi:hypothetical protein